MIVKHQYDFFILGLPVYQGYYTHHSMQSSTIGFLPLSSGTKSMLEEGEIPTTVLEPLEGFHCTSTTCKVFKAIWYLICLPFKIMWWCIKIFWWTFKVCCKILSFMMYFIWRLFKILTPSSI